MLSKLKQIHLEEWLLGAMLGIVCVLFPLKLGAALMIYKKPMLAVGTLILSLILWRKKRLFFPSDAFSWLFAAFVGWHFLSALWADHVAEVWKSSFYWLSLFVLYLNIRSLDLKHFSKWFWQRLLLTILLVNVLFPGYFFYQELFESEGHFQLTLRYSAELRAYFSYHKNDIISILLISIPLIALLHEQPRNKWVLAILIPYSLFLILIGSRLALLIFAVLAIYYAVLYRQEWHTKRLLIGLPMLLITLILLTLGLADDPERFWYIYNPLRSADAGGSDARLVIWESSQRLLAENPLGGIGSGNWHTAYMKFGGSQLDAVKDVPNAHSLPLETGAELGLLGLGLVLLLLCLPLVRLLRKAPGSLFGRHLSAVLISFLLIASVYGVAYNPNKALAPAQWLWLAAVALFYAKEMQSVHRFRFAIPLVLLGMLACSWSFFLLSKELQYQRYSIQLANNKPQAAFKSLKEMHHPGIFDFYEKKHLSHLKALRIWELNKKALSLKLLEEVAASCPYDYRNWFQLGEKYRQTGKFPLAVRAFEQSLQIYNDYVPAALGLAKSSLETQDEQAFDKAIAVYQVSIVPVIERLYREEIWESTHQEELDMWNILCRQQAQFELLQAVFNSSGSK